MADLTPERACAYCSGVLGGRAGRDSPPWDTVLADFGSFVIAPSKGALIPGWLLVISKRHVLCSGAFSNTEVDAFEAALTFAQDLVGSHFGPPTVFEHGPTRPGTALGCGIDHAHTHVVALPFSLSAAIGSVIPSENWHPLASFSGTRDIHIRGLEYTVVAEPNCAQQWLTPPPGTRQFLRRVVANGLGCPELFDYSEYPHEDNVRRALGTLQVAVGA